MNCYSQLIVEFYDNDNTENIFCDNHHYMKII